MPPQLQSLFSPQRSHAHHYEGHHTDGKRRRVGASGEVGKQLANLASDFDPRTFGFRKLSDLVRKTNSFEIDHPKGGSMRIRTKFAAGSPPKSKTVTKLAT
jgi:Fe-S-cluster formation regulator IscX/YfhJ